MSVATKSPQRRPTIINGHPDGPTLDEQASCGCIDTLIAFIRRLAITPKRDRDPLLSFEPTDKILRLTSTSEAGHVQLYRNNEPKNVLRDWTLAAFKDTAQNKTLSILIQGHGLSPVVAKSGWSEYLNQDVSWDIYSPINGTKYTELAWRLCRSLGCSLPPTGIERGRPPGYFLASHAEMQLMAWFVERYFPRLLEDVPETLRMEPPLVVENVLIISNNTRRYACYRQLAGRVEELTGVTFTIEYRGPGVQR